MQHAVTAAEVVSSCLNTLDHSLILSTHQPGAKMQYLGRQVIRTPGLDIRYPLRRTRDGIHKWNTDIIL